jgi:hypothetical protein
MQKLSVASSTRQGGAKRHGATGMALGFSLLRSASNAAVKLPTLVLNSSKQKAGIQSLKTLETKWST